MTMSVEVVASCQQLSCGICRSTPCKCGRHRTNKSDIFLQRFPMFRRCLVPLTPPVCPLVANSHDWKHENSAVICFLRHEKRDREEPLDCVHSTLPTALPTAESDMEDSSDEFDDDGGGGGGGGGGDYQGVNNTFIAPEREEICSGSNFQQQKISSIPARFIESLDRKLSDPAVMVRKERISYSLRQQRRYSDGNSGVNMEEEWSEEGSSHLGCDSGFNDDFRPKVRSSYNTVGSLAFSDIDMETPHSNKVRRLTPHPLSIEKDACQLLSSEGGCGSHFIMLGHRPKQRSTKHHSVSSIASVGGASTGGTSVGGASTGGASSNSSIGSLWEFDSPETIADILSSLGFDNFESPQLIPDRFIPSVIEHAKPSVMRLHLTTEEGLGASLGGLGVPLGGLGVPPGGTDPIDLPLGATAETFLQKPTTPPHNATPPPQPVTDPLPIPRPCAIQLLDPTVSQFVRSKGVLEPVPEETASDLSPSPRWFSPRVSIDHSVDVLDLQEGKLGSALLQKQRKRSLPQRDGYRHSLGSQVESEPDSIYFSVTSYDDDIMREREKEREELCPPPLVDDPVQQQRRRRRGVYTPPPGLMSWLSSQHPISEEQQNQDQDPEELPWPFSEQARLRKSLSEIEQAQKSPFYEPTSNYGSGHENALLIKSVVSPCQSPQISDDEGNSHSGSEQGWRGDSPSSASDVPVDTREGVVMSQEEYCLDRRQLDGRQRGDQDVRQKEDRRPLLHRKRLSWQLGDGVDLVSELLEA